MEKTFLTYEEFGAVGNGVNDDFEAIIACHNAANEMRLPVVAKKGATYYIGGSSKTAIVKTSVDFTGAKFIIDDRSVESITSYVFTVLSDFEMQKININSELLSTSKKVKTELNGNYFVKVCNSNSRIYIRKGLNMNNGTAMQEVFVLDKEGNVYPSVNWDYTEITEAYARCTDDQPITITGGHFVTIANEQESFYRYHQRGFEIRRSHVVMSDIYHTVENEGDHGAPYHGFIRANEAFDVTIKDSLLTPRLIYWTQSKIPGKMVPMGSYDLSFWSSIDVRCINIKQTIDILDNKYWGIYTSNFCKNLLLEDCEFSRFDAHMGVTNATIRRCTLGHQRIQLIGHGEFLMEDCTVKSGLHFIYLRDDYGSFWNGNITVRRCKWFPSCNCQCNVIGGYNVGDHDYGYECRYGRTITIEDLYIDDDAYPDNAERKIVIIRDNNFLSESPHVAIPPEKLVLKNIKISSGKPYVLCTVDAIKDVEVE